MLRDSHFAHAIRVLSASHAVFADARPPDMLIHIVALHTVGDNIKDSRVYLVPQRIVMQH